MAWPNPNEYVEALQNPQQAFSDPDLRAGQVTTTKLGLPRPISGNFATVFEVKRDDRWAVRCFCQVTNQQQRYAAIAAHLKCTLPCMVNFECLPEGIPFRGCCHPPNGLDFRHAARPTSGSSRRRTIWNLASRWLTLCHSLREAVAMRTFSTATSS